MLYLMTVVFIISVANIGTSSEQQRSKRNAINNPCQNGGTFTQNDGCFTCTCADGWAGALCNEVDGNKGTDISVDKCAGTNVGDLFPWWSVDLQAVYNITSVRIFNRGKDSSGIDVAARLRYVTVTICDENHVSHQWCPQPHLNRRLPSGDFLIRGSILASDNNYGKVALWVEMLS
uniref:EGF-like domain-containing protein n=1 Tax=Magallana gigas TaxID=29159 RepID=A0A8W8MM43_MAGGI